MSGGAKVRTMVAKEAFQVTDLQRNYRVVLSEARESGALIRDKDGLMLLIQPARDTERTQYLNELMADAIRMGKVLHSPQSERSAGHYGSLAWASVLTEKDQAEFLKSLTDQLLISQYSGSTEALEDLLGDWQATALAWADDELREDLSESLEHPLADVEL